jgi:hypothetical protein
MHTNRKYCFEDLGADERNLKKFVGTVWTGFFWLRIGSSSGLL